MSPLSLADTKFIEDNYEHILVCPYCMNEVQDGQQLCCGESSAHFQKVYLDRDGNELSVSKLFEENKDNHAEYLGAW